MPSCDWLQHAAVRGCLIAALILPCGVRGEENPQPKEPPAKTDTGPQPTIVLDTSILRDIAEQAMQIFRHEKAANEASEERKERREESDLRAQWDQAWWAAESIFWLDSGGRWVRVDGVDANHVIPKIPQGESLFFWFKVKYRGPVTNGHETSACWRYDMETGQFVQYGGAEYNYSR